MKQAYVALLILAFLISGCASKVDEQAAQNAASNEQNANFDVELVEEEPSTTGAYDPFEPINRVVWDFNRDVLDRFLVKPATKVYVNVTPQPVRTGLLNAAENLGEPASTINNLLQGKPVDSATSAGRFLVNSTVGILGIFDVANSMGLEQKEEDFNQVLGVWGVGTGPYLMLPALGPSDFRDFVGTYVDRFYWPETVMEDPYTISAAVVRLLETRATLLDQEANLERALDQYLFVRDAYFQRTAFEVSDGEIGQRSEEELEQEADDFEDFEALFDDIPEQ